MPDRNCRACQRPLYFERSIHTGKVVAVDPRPPVYVLWRGEGDVRVAGTLGYLVNEQGFRLCRELPDGSREEIEIEAFGVSHFATCPKANQFSRKGAQA